MVFDHLSYRELIEDFFNDFLIEYGKLKFEKINKKVQVSNKISNLIYISKQKKVVPNKNDFLFSINSIPFFMFSKAETIALGCLLSLERWNKECNNQLKLAADATLKNIAIQMLEDCKKLKFK